MRHLATIETILDIQPIEGADAIEKIKVREWWCVAKKGEFTVGSDCVYFEIDSLLPSSVPAFGFLAKGSKEKTMVIDGKEYKGYRLKTIRLRGQISQGLALPLASLTNYSSIPLSETGPGDDVTEALGIVKYEPPIPANLAGQVKGFFPAFLRKTDEERIQNCSDLLERHKDEWFYVTEKLDGSSCTYYKKDGEFGVCSRNLELKDTEGNTLWQIAHQLGLPEKMKDNTGVQGELVGNGVQGNPLKINGHRFFAFNVFDITEQKFYSFEEFLQFCQDSGIDNVPIVDPNFLLNKTVTELLEYATGESILNPLALREGVVIRPQEEQEDMINGAIGRLSFKVISNEYLLNHE